MVHHDAYPRLTDTLPPLAITAGGGFVVPAPFAGKVTSTGRCCNFGGALLVVVACGLSVISRRTPCAAAQKQQGGSDEVLALYPLSG